MSLALCGRFSKALVELGFLGFALLLRSLGFRRRIRVRFLFRVGNFPRRC